MGTALDRTAAGGTQVSRVIDALERRMEAGLLRAGQRLPSIRQTAGAVAEVVGFGVA